MKEHIIHLLFWIGFSAIVYYGTGTAIIESVIWAGIIMAGMIVMFTDALPTYKREDETEDWKV